MILFERGLGPVEAIMAALDAYGIHGGTGGETEERALGAVHQECEAYFRDEERDEADRLMDDRVLELVDAVNARAEALFPRRGAAARWDVVRRVYGPGLRGPAGRGLAVNARNRLEVATRGHVPSERLGDLVDEWKDSRTTVDFETWLTRFNVPTARFRWTVDPTYRVRYLDEAARRRCRLTVRDGRVTDADGLAFDTRALSTTRRGEGFCAYVMDAFGNLYAHGHQSRRFHHSSFFAGGRVRAAGELRVLAGRLVGMTDHSGHYQPGPDAVRAVLGVLEAKGVVLADVRIASREAPHRWTSAARVLSAGGAIAACPTATPPPGVHVA